MLMYVTLGLPLFLNPESCLDPGSCTLHPTSCLLRGHAHVCHPGPPPLPQSRQHLRGCHDTRGVLVVRWVYTNICVNKEKSKKSCFIFKVPSHQIRSKRYGGIGWYVYESLKEKGFFYLAVFFKIKMKFSQRYIADMLGFVCTFCNSSTTSYHKLSEPF